MAIIAAREGLIYEGLPVLVGTRLNPPPGGSRLQHLLEFGWVVDDTESLLDVGLEPHEDGSPEQDLDEPDVEETPAILSDPDTMAAIEEALEEEPEPKPEQVDTKPKGKQSKNARNTDDQE